MIYVTKQKKYTANNNLKREADFFPCKEICCLFSFPDMIHVIILTISFFLLFPLTSYGQKDYDSTSLHNIQEVDIVLKRPDIILSNNNGRLYWNMSALETMPHVLGSADPLRSLQLLPGVVTNNDYTSGVHVQGCDPSQSLLEMDGAPVFYPSHLLGLFSVFTTSHFRGLTFVQNRHDASASNILGGQICFFPIDSLSHNFHINATFSIIESEGTLSLPTSEKSTLYLSGRGSYLNLFYKNLLKADDLILDYGLQDYNFTWQYIPNDLNRFRITAYYGEDKLNFIQDGIEKANSLYWYNSLLSLNWFRNMPLCTMQQTVYGSRYQNQFLLNFGSYDANTESSIQQYGYKLKLNGNPDKINWKTGVDYAHTILNPLSYHIYGSYMDKKYQPMKIVSHEASIFADVNFEFNKKWHSDIGLRTSLYSCIDMLKYNFDPRITLTYQPNIKNSFYLYYGRLHQYSRQIALSNGSFPIDYWSMAHEKIAPQEAHSFALDYNFRSTNGFYGFSAGIYTKLMNEQGEVGSNILDILLQDNPIEENLLLGKGINYGINLQLRKELGQITGWIGYTFGYSLRQFDNLESGRWIPSNHDRRHDLAVVANYKLNDFLTLSGNFIYATGTPYTGTHHVYMINNNLISEYGAHNGSNLPPTHRLDLSATYYFKKNKKAQHSINLSIYNAYAHKNELFRFIKYNNTGIQIKPVYSLCRALPSIGYTIKL